jgi:aminopeptidase N
MKHTALLSAILTLCLSAFANAGVHHQLELTLAPAVKSLGVLDKVTLEGPKNRRFILNKNLQVLVLSAGDKIRQLPSPATVNYNDYELQLGPEDQEVSLQYAGVLYEPITDNETTGLVSPEGAVLFGASNWLPDFSEKATFEITKARLPQDWKLASPQAQLKIPQQDISLIAGPFNEYTLKDPASGIPFKVFLKTADPVLAETYLNLLPSYLDHYQKTLGAYPYESFAVIENFWETGFGLPAMTLLGPGVMRLPFILNSSLPHELLHNWWGNSVFVDYERGNWCEGLTNYLADHWQQEVLKNGREYRRQALMNFQDYTKASADFPLRHFKQRFNFSSQAVGYGKGMMFFHMLKVKLGEALFSQALKDLYRSQRGQTISYEEIQIRFEKSSGQDLKLFFKQWLDQIGAPALKLAKASQSLKDATTSQVSFELSQLSAQNYDLLVPVRLSFQDGSVQTENLALKTSSQNFELQFSKPVKSLEVDPDFDVFRNLDAQERPLSLSSVFGAKDLWILGSDETLQKSYQQTWQSSLAGNIKLGDNKTLLDLPLEGAVVLLGDSPEYEKLMLEQLAGQDIKVSADEIQLFGVGYKRLENKMAFVARSSTHPGLILVWIRGQNLEALAPRLLHYGKYGVLVFAETSVSLKTTWPLLTSPLKVDF